MIFSMVMSCSPHLCLPRSHMVMQKTIRCSASVSTASESIQFDLKNYWTTLIRDINQKLDEAVPVKYPNQIYEAMRYSVLAKGAKRSPPIMCVAACELFGGNRLAAFPTACALEMVCSSFSVCIHHLILLGDKGHTLVGLLMFLKTLLCLHHLS